MPLSDDDEVVVKVAWEEPEEAESTGSQRRACWMARRPCCETSSRRCELRLIRSGDSYRGMGCVVYHMVFGGSRTGSS